MTEIALMRSRELDKEHVFGRPRRERPMEDERISAFAKRFGIGVLFVLATAVGIVSLRYLLPVVPFPARLPNVHLKPTLIAVHAGFAAVALLVGPWQFVFRRGGAAHVARGRIYIACVALGTLAAIALALTAATGVVAELGFLMLAALWATTTALAVRAVRARRTAAHATWMMRSYALTAAAITLRIELGLMFAFHIPFEVGYPAIAWACWLPNLLAVECLLLVRTYRIA